MGSYHGGHPYPRLRWLIRGHEDYIRAMYKAYMGKATDLKLS